MISKRTSAPKCMKVYYTQRILPTCFGHLCGHFQGGALKRISISNVTEVFKQMDGCTICNIKCLFVY